MRQLALRSLFHDRGKLAASIAGVAFAAALLLVQIGLFAGFVGTSSAMIRRVGGDVWVMARGTEVLDNAEPLSPGSRSLLAGHPCARRVRALVLGVTPLRKPSGAIDYAQIVGVEPGPVLLPWSLEQGLPGDLRGPARVFVDEHDLGKLQLPRPALGATVEVGGREARVAGLTAGIRSFALYPYLFAEVGEARALAGLGEGQAHYWVVDTVDAQCAPLLASWASRLPDLDAHTSGRFAEMTESFWVYGSGAGAALGFSALFALTVGAVIVGQTLYSITKEHLRELCTLKAIGATPGELRAFVAWQAGFLAVVGYALGLSMAACLRGLLSSQGIEASLSWQVVLGGAAAVAAMCALASAPSLGRVLSVDPAEVFR